MSTMEKLLAPSTASLSSIALKSDRAVRAIAVGPKGIIILCCLSVLVVAMYMIGDGIGDCVGGPVPVVNSPPDIAGIAPPAPTASSGCIQRLPDVAGLSTNSFWRDCDPPLPGGTAADPPPFSAPTADPPGGRW